MLLKYLFLEGTSIMVFLSLQKYEFVSQSNTDRNNLWRALVSPPNHYSLSLRVFISKEKGKSWLIVIAIEESRRDIKDSAKLKRILSYLLIMDSKLAKNTVKLESFSIQIGNSQIVNKTIENNHKSLQELKRQEKGGGNFAKRSEKQMEIKRKGIKM